MGVGNSSAGLRQCETAGVVLPERGAASSRERRRQGACGRARAPARALGFIDGRSARRRVCASWLESERFSKSRGDQHRGRSSMTRSRSSSTPARSHLHFDSMRSALALPHGFPCVTTMSGARTVDASLARERAETACLRCGLTTVQIQVQSSKPARSRGHSDGELARGCYAFDSLCVIT